MKLIIHFDFQPGWYITVHVDNVPEELYNTKGEQPIVLYGMLPHEQKMSVLNMVLKRPNISTQGQCEPIKSKEQLIFQCGYRRFKACPIFSQHTNGSKHKVSEILLCIFFSLNCWVFSLN